MLDLDETWGNSKSTMEELTYGFGVTLPLFKWLERLPYQVDFNFTHNNQPAMTEHSNFSPYTLLMLGLTYIP